MLAQLPPCTTHSCETGEDGFGFVNLEKFKVGFAGDTSDADAAFLRDSQVPINRAIFGTPVSHAAWRDKPSWALIATEDKAIDPKLLRHTAERIGATIIEVPASHVPFLTQPQAVADAIDRAAQASGENRPAGTERRCPAPPPQQGQVADSCRCRKDKRDSRSLSLPVLTNAALETGCGRPSHRGLMMYVLQVTSSGV